VFNHTQFSGINSTLNFTSLTNPTPTNLYLKPDGSINNINGLRNREWRAGSSHHAVDGQNPLLSRGLEFRL